MILRCDGMAMGVARRQGSNEEERGWREMQSIVHKDETFSLFSQLVISYCIPTQKRYIVLTILRYASNPGECTIRYPRLRESTSLPNIPKQIITATKTPSPSSARLRSNRTSMTPPPKLLILLHVKPTGVSRLRRRSCRGRHVAPAAVEGCLHRGSGSGGFESV